MTSQRRYITKTIDWYPSLCCQDFPWAPFVMGCFYMILFIGPGTIVYTRFLEGVRGLKNYNYIDLGSVYIYLTSQQHLKLYMILSLILENNRNINWCGEECEFLIPIQQTEEWRKEHFVQDTHKMTLRQKTEKSLFCSSLVLMSS